MDDIVLNQAVSCPDGNGIVTNIIYYENSSLIKYIFVETFNNNRKCGWDPCNIHNIKPRK